MNGVKMSTDGMIKLSSMMFLFAIVCFILKAVSGVALIAAFGWGVLVSGIIVGLTAFVLENK
jgi:uncharacterized membrane protein HdeD (DUF308 family)